MPPWNPVLGHLYFCYQITAKLPKDVHTGYITDMIRREMPNLGPDYYLDTWPFGPQMLIWTSLNGLHQVTQGHSLPKFPALKSFIEPIAEGMDIVTMEGEAWKLWRGIFNPGFSSSYLLNLTDGIVEETEEFCKHLRALCKSSAMFRMRSLTDFLTMDVIGRVVKNTQIGSQQHRSPLVDGLRSQIQWLAFEGGLSPALTRYNPIRPFVLAYNSRRMNNYIIPKIETRFRELQETISGPNVTRSILDLVLSTYLKENAVEGVKHLDSVFKRFSMNQVKLFLFAGHDTTSSTTCYIFYIFATKPRVLSKIREQHDAIFGKEVSRAKSILSGNASLLNKLPYTTAVLKEVMRLYPAASSIRTGEPNFCVTDNSGRSFPTDGFLVWDNSQAVHRDPAHWPKPDEFIPERWLVDSDDPMHPVKGAWRTFSHGPRNCIGQELAMIEMNVIMVLTAREFDFRVAYDEIDQGESPEIKRTVYGERAYQINRRQPSEDLPCYVTQSAS